MKILVLILLSMTITTSVFACQCQSQGDFTESDIKNSLKSFMENKLNISINNIENINLIDSKYFLSIKNKAYLAKMRLTFASGYSCVKSCARFTNRKQQYVISYRQDEKKCKVRLKLKMTTKEGNPFYGGIEAFTSKVSQKYRPICL